MKAKTKVKRRPRKSLYFALALLAFLAVTSLATPFKGVLLSFLFPELSCSLAEQIEAANSDKRVGDCPAGDGVDTIVLHDNLLLTESLPAITSPIVIEGAGHTIKAGGQFRIFRLNAGSLEIRDLTLTGGMEQKGGAVLARNGAKLIILRSTLADNIANDGGAVFAQDAEVIIVNSSLKNNEAVSQGGAVFIKRSDLTVESSHINSNTAESGGGLYFKDANVSIDGATISRNRANSWNSGSGVYSMRSEVSILNSDINGNYNGRRGGGVYVNGGSLHLENSNLQGNRATYGSGIYVETGEVEVEKSRITRNSAMQLGGGMKVVSGDVTIRNSFISNNRAADYGGGIGSRGWLTIEDSEFTANHAGKGGAIRVWGGKTVIKDTAIFANSATHFGAAVAISDGRLTIERSGLNNNQSQFLGGAIYSESESKLYIRNTALAGNSAKFAGAGVFIRDSEVTLVHVTIAQNSSARPGGGLRNVDGTVKMRNSIIAGNQYSDCYALDGLAVNVNNLIADGTCDPMISGDPMLLTPSGSSEYLALQVGSPALNAANPNFCPTTDHRGNPRPLGAACDLGAYESGPAN